MSPSTVLQLHFPKSLFLDRRRGLYTFEGNDDTVLVVNAYEQVGLEDLELLYHPYASQALQSSYDMFDAEVLRIVEEQERAQLRALAASARGDPERPEDRRETGSATETIELSEALRPHAALDAAPVVSSEDAARRAAPGGPPPAAQARELKKGIVARFDTLLAGGRGGETLLAGTFDNEIRDMVTDLARGPGPRHLLVGQGLGKNATPAQETMEKTVTTQAFGAQLELSESDLFAIAKSALGQLFSRSGYKQQAEIKRVLLRRDSPSLEYKLCHYYNDIERFLEARKVDAGVIRLVRASKFIYLSRPTRDLDSATVALAVADAFLVLKGGELSTIEILDILPQRLRRALPQALAALADRTEQLLRDCCYNEFRQSFSGNLEGGDHCDFFPLGGGRRGLVIFDVSGHEARASRFRNLLVDAFSKLHDRSDPAQLVTILNRFCLKYPLPMDLFVSMVYGVVDSTANTLTYANAGHHPPYLVRGERIIELEDTGGLALNIMDFEYEKAEVGLQAMDCLVFYTDGLIEAVHSGQAGGAPGLQGKQLFGKERLTQAIRDRQVAKRRANEAVDLILAAARDEGFVIEDDITVQVYRHL